MAAHPQSSGKTRWVSPSTSHREGGEQGDPLMPMLFALGQHGSLEAAQARLGVGERLMAFLDDIHCRARQTGSGIVAVVEQKMQARAHIRIGLLSDAAKLVKPEAVVWRGDTELLERTRSEGLGVPIGQPAHVQEFLAKKGREQDTLFQRIPWACDPQAAWLFILMCGSTCANFWLRAVASQIAMMPRCGSVCGCSGGP